MNPEIKYKDDSGNLISFQQAKKLKNYSKLSYLSGSLKKEEDFIISRGIPKKYITYYLDTNEDKTAILQDLVNLNNSYSNLIYFNKQSSNGFDLWDWESYSQEGELKFVGKQVFDNKSRSIFYCTFDLITKNLKDLSQKFFYANEFENEYKDRLIEVRYNVDGSVYSIIDSQERFGYIKALDLDEFLADIHFSQINFPWKEHPYYHTAYPFLPEGPL